MNDDCEPENDYREIYMFTGRRSEGSGCSLWSLAAGMLGSAICYLILIFPRRSFSDVDSIPNSRAYASPQWSAISESTCGERRIGSMVRSPTAIYSGLLVASEWQVRNEHRDHHQRCQVEGLRRLCEQQQDQSSQNRQCDHIEDSHTTHDVLSPCTG